MIQLAIDDYHQNTPIRFKQYDPQTDRDYIYITGEDSGCWSYVGRLGGVSNTEQCVVTQSPALRTTSWFEASTFVPPNNIYHVL